MPSSFGADLPTKPPAALFADEASSSATIVDPNTPGIHQPRVRWHYTFFVLAAIGIAAITASLSFSRALTEDFAQAVSSNYEWVEREALYAELVKLSSECAQPGIDVFNSRDAAAERQRLAKSLAVFRSRLDIAHREARINIPKADLKAVEERLDQIVEGAGRIEAETLRILNLSEQDDYDTAGGKLARLNQISSEVSDEIVRLYSGIRAVQSRGFESQLQDAEQLRAYQTWFLFGILAMVVVVALYGNRLSRAALETISTITTQARNLADREARLRTIFNSAAEGIITITEQGIVESCNQATLDLFQLPGDRIIGSPLEDLVERSVSTGEDARTARIRNVDSLVGTRQELIAYRPDGSRIIVDFSAAEVRFPDHRVITGILHDITEQKLFEAQLEQARFVAESASKARTLFLANMSHEIRTPMTSILGFAELLADPDQTPEERSRCVETIRSNADHLLSLINDILDLSRIEAGRMTLEKTRCCPAQIVNEVVSLMRDRAASNGLDLNVVFDSPVPEFIHSDPVRLRQILINLIGNAVKFTHEGSVQVQLRFDSETQQQPRMIFRVIDTGIGIATAQQSRLFRAFTQADSSTTRQFDGTGLGLAISKRLVELLGGTISVLSAEGLGATFEFDLPTGPLEDTSMIDSPDVVATSSRSTPKIAADVLPVAAEVLLVEDGPDNRRLISHHLRKAGVEVTSVENGQLAIEAVGRREKPFDLILMDMQMPVLDGYSATTELRKNGYEGEIAALTAHAMTGDRERCLEAGCDGYLTKPIDAVQLIETVRRAAEQSTTPTEVDSLPPIVSEFADDPDMAEIVEAFVEGLMDRFVCLAEAHAAGDLDLVSTNAHQLKGSGGGYGFPAVTSAAAKIEQLAKDPHPDHGQCLAAINELKMICQRITGGQPDEQTKTQPAATVRSKTAAVEFSVQKDSALQVSSLIGGGESPQSTIERIEELAASDPEWMEVSDLLQNLTTILRQTSTSEPAADLEDVESNADTGASVVA
jgi:PAS domain S-box-containing protein